MSVRRRWIIAGLGVATALGLALYVSLSGADRHQDGAGPLGSNGVPGHEAFKADPLGGRTSWTYGVRLCLAQGSSPAILESVAAETSVGTGFQFLGDGVRTFVPAPSHQPIISSVGWPPAATDVPDPINRVAGFEVTTPCGNGASDPYTELLIGLQLLSPDGGGWRGIAITYTAGGQRHVLVLDHDLMICGRSVDCSGPR